MGRRTFGPTPWQTQATLGLLASLRAVEGKVVSGRVTLAPRQARVLTKFCFDFNPQCQELTCPQELHPGLVTVDLWGASGDGASSTAGPPTPSPSPTPVPAKTNTSAAAAGASVAAVAKDAKEASHNANGPKVHLALLDDEYFSFPEVSEVWEEVKCKDLLKAAKRTLDVDMGLATKTLEHEGQHLSTNVVEKVRPRWWYIALVSCADDEVSMSYSLHLTNGLRGFQSELSMDTQWVGLMALLQAAVLGTIATKQMRSAKDWRASGSAKTSRRFLRMHPAVLLVTLAAMLAGAGGAAWLLYFWACQQAGMGSSTAAFVGRACIVGSKTVISVLLMLLARGQCVCTPDISWREHKEIVMALFLFGFVAFWLETYGESEVRNMSTEYIYDTRPGTALVALDMLWLWLYSSRAWASWQAETRVRPRLFFRQYILPLTLWFAALPIIACVGQLLAPWVRFKVLFAVNAIVLAATLSLLVYSFQPTVAEKLYEFGFHEYEPVGAEDLASFMAEDEDDDDI